MKVRYITSRESRRVAIYEITDKTFRLDCNANDTYRTIVLEWKELVQILKHRPRPIKKPLVRKPLP